MWKYIENNLTNLNFQKLLLIEKKKFFNKIKDFYFYYFYIVFNFTWLWNSLNRRVFINQFKNFLPIHLFNLFIMFSHHYCISAPLFPVIPKSIKNATFSARSFILPLIYSIQVIIFGLNFILKVEKIMIFFLRVF